MKRKMRWIALLAALALLPACSAPPRGASPATTSPLSAPATVMTTAQIATEMPAATTPATQMPMTQSSATPNAPQVDPDLIAPTETAASTSMEVPVNSPAVQAAIAALIKQLGGAAQTIKVISVEEVEWPDGCLGLGRPEEACLQAIVPGYRVLLEVNNRQYEARTDQDAHLARIVPDAIPLASQAPVSTTNAPQVDSSLIVPSPMPASTSMEASPDAPAVQAAIAALAQQLNVDAQSVKVVSVEQVDWPDGCLGLAKPDQMCTQVIVPGYRVMLDVNGKSYEVRTSLNGKQVTLVPQR